MRLFSGFAMVMVGLFFGLYVGAYLCLFGGIVQVVQSITAVEVDAIGVAMGIVRVLITGVAGWFSAAILIFPGLVLMSMRE